MIINKGFTSVIKHKSQQKNFLWYHRARLSFFIFSFLPQCIAHTNCCNSSFTNECSFLQQADITEVAIYRQPPSCKNHCLNSFHSTTAYQHVTILSSDPPFHDFLLFFSFFGQTTFGLCLTPRFLFNFGFHSISPNFHQHTTNPMQKLI